MLPLFNFYWFRIDTKHMTEPWFDQSLMDSAYRSKRFTYLQTREQKIINKNSSSLYRYSRRLLYVKLKACPDNFYRNICQWRTPKMNSLVLSILESLMLGRFCIWINHHFVICVVIVNSPVFSGNSRGTLSQITRIFK